MSAPFSVTTLSMQLEIVCKRSLDIQQQIYSDTQRRRFHLKLKGFMLMVYYLSKSVGTGPACKRLQHSRGFC